MAAGSTSEGGSGEERGKGTAAGALAWVMVAIIDEQNMTRLQERERLRLPIRLPGWLVLRTHR